MSPMDQRDAETRVTREVVVRADRAAVTLGGRLIWHDVSFDIFNGEFVAILGPNGAGKSTLIKAILGLLPLSEGSISILGQPVRRGNRHVGYVPQRRSFDAGVHVRGRDVVRLGLDGARWGTPIPGLERLLSGSRLRDSKDRVQQAIELVHATEYADRPIGLLSGGEQQRLLIAQALVTQPRIMLLDEPLDSLDLRNQGEMSAVIRRISQESNTTVLLVAHDVNPLLPYLDRVCYVARGHTALGAPQQIITTETLSRLYGAPIEVVRTPSGQLVVVGQPEGVPCAEHHHAGRER
ncbi:MAG: ABC transporter ATP-binding protein [Chloroflexota bacterium]